MSDQTNTAPTLEERVAALETRVETFGAKLEGMVAEIIGKVEVAAPTMVNALHDKVAVVETILAGISNEMKHVLAGRAAAPGNTAGSDQHG